MSTNDELDPDLVREAFNKSGLLAATLSSPIHDAAAKGNLAKLQAFAGDGIRVDLLDSINNTPLHWAAGAGHDEVVRWLCEQNANLNLQNMMGDTPLHRAVWRSHKNTVKILLENGAKWDIKNTMGKLPIDLVRDSEVGETLQSYNTIYQAEQWMLANPPDGQFDGFDYSNDSENSSTEE